MHRFICMFLFFISFFTISYSCGNSESAPEAIFDFCTTNIPLKIPQRKLEPLNTLVDISLEQKLINELRKNKKWSKLIEEQKFAIGLVDLKDTGNVKFASVNGNVEMYAASLPKIAVLLASIDAIEKNELEGDQDNYQDMRRMISFSDNNATTRMIDKLGYEKIEKVLTHPRYMLYDTANGGGLWVGKRYAKTGNKYPDPLKGLSHAATADQVCKFYYMLLYGQLVNYNRSSEMLHLMENPDLHHKFINTLEKISPDARLFRKSGTWQDYHSDSVLVWGENKRYILCALIEDSQGEDICRQLVYIIDRILSQKSQS